MLGLRIPSACPDFGMLCPGLGSLQSQSCPGPCISQLAGVETVLSSMARLQGPHPVPPWAGNTSLPPPVRVPPSILQCPFDTAVSFMPVFQVLGTAQGAEWSPEHQSCAPWEELGLLWQARHRAQHCLASTGHCWEKNHSCATAQAVRWAWGSTESLL